MKKNNTGYIKLKTILFAFLYYLFSWSHLFAQSPVYANQPLDRPNTVGEYYNNTSITLSPGFSADGVIGTFKAFINTTLPATNPGPSTDQNFVSTWQPRSAISSVNALKALEYSTSDININVKYNDGLGRPLQSVDIGATSSSNADFIQPYEYDNLGRQIKNYLPYAGSTGTAGSYRPNATISEQAAFYNNSTGNVIPVSSSPFSTTLIESSPLERVFEKGSPGDYWQLSGSGIANSGHTVRFQYTDNNQIAISDAANTRIAVQFYVYISNVNRYLLHTSSNYYPNSDLYVTIARDENWSAANGRLGSKEVYKDKDGKIVLKRSFIQNATNGIDILSTYFVYDDFGNLSYVIPPGANPDAVSTTGYNITQSILDQLCYQYQYDEKHRVTGKKVPGKDWEYIVYNSLDQIVATQNGNQRLKNEWIIKKYDGLARPIIIGISNNNFSRDDLQSLVNQQTSLWEERTSNGIGYSSSAWPQTINTYYSINYYDDYNVPGFPSGYAYQSYTGNPNGITNQTQGHLTVTKTWPLSNSSMDLWSVSYYDSNDRVIQMQNTNHLSGKDIYNYEYDFSGQTTKTVHQQNSNSQAVTIANRFVYDHHGRLIQNFEQIDNDPEILLAQNEYNDLGQIIDKKIHQKNSSSRFLQSIDYRYNIRGWLTSINDPSLAQSSSMNADDLASSDVDKFGMQFQYEQALYPQYNGNIGSIQWQAASLNNGMPMSPQLKYDFSYDKINRLTKAQSSTGTVSDDNFDENLSYDWMGNIQSLKRWAKLSTGRTQIDNLIYTYSGNQVTEIDDISNNNTYGFSETVNGNVIQQANEYVYDADGNVVHDLNKGISLITYNDFDLPATITWSSGKSLTYDYDGMGGKLSKVFYNGSSSTTVDYVNGVQYVQGQIAFLMTDEGIARKNAGGGGISYVYQYALKDNLGNTRVMIQPDYPLQTTAQVMQLSSYYPFGLEQKSDDPNALMAYISGVKNNYLYNGKEEQDDIGMYDYGARQYDPAIGRWYVNDKLADAPEQVDKSPYAYGWNNPAKLKDPDGNCPICIIAIGAAIGGVINTATHWDKIMSSGHPWRDGIAAFGIGAVAGGVATAAGAAVLTGAAVSGLAAIGSAVASGITAGATSSYIQGVGNSIYFHDPFGVSNVLSGAVLGGVTAGLFKGIELSFSSSNSGFTISGGQGEATGYWNETTQEFDPPASNTPKLITQFSESSIDKGVAESMRTQNNIDHIFDIKHNLDPFVNKLGGQENTIRAVLKAAMSNGKLPSAGVFDNVFNFLGSNLRVEGIVRNGIPQLSTMFVVP